MDQRPKKPRTKKPEENQRASTQGTPSEDVQPRKSRKRLESGGEQKSGRKKEGDNATPKRAKLGNNSKNLNKTQSIIAPKKSDVPPPDSEIPQPPSQPPPRPPRKPVLTFTSEEEFSQPKPKLIPATVTGFKELKMESAFLIALLWLPRYFIPWITAWYDFNLYILSNPYHWEARQGDLDKHELYAFCCSCSIAIISAVVYETLQKKFDLKYYLFMILLLFFTLTPVVGGFVDVLLRAGFVDSQLYTDWWFTGVVLMRWLMGSSFAMFPMQFACIYAQNNNMSRNAHYNWTSIFVFFEFLNAYIAFWVIPPKCPTREWIQVVVWVIIGIMLITVMMMCLIFLFAVPALRYVMLKCITYCGKKKKVGLVAYPEPDPFLSVPELRMKKLLFSSMILLPVVCSYFSFAVLERFVPDEDWDKHYLWSATSMFYMGRMIGVVVMVLVMFCVRRVLKNRPQITVWRAEMFYMGVPHVLSILAFLALAGRFANLSHLKEGEIIRGPIPDDEKTVLLIFNIMFRNRTVCISSEYFRPVKIRPFSFATRELFDIGVNNFTVNVTVDPCADSRLQSQFVVDNFKKGDWVVFALAIPTTNLTNEYVWDYYSRLCPVRLLRVEHLRPKGVPQIVIFDLRRYFPRESWFYQLNHTGLPPIELMVANALGEDEIGSIELFKKPRDPVIFDASATGTWRPTVIGPHSKSPKLKAWIENATYFRNIKEFEVRNFSIDYMIDYYYHESIRYGIDVPVLDPGKRTRHSERKHPYQDLVPNYQFVGNPEGMILFTVAEIAGPNSDQLPAKQQLQQDWAIKVGLTLAGMAAGGLFHGFVYLFWLDPPIPAYRTTILAVYWVLMGGASEIPKIKLVDIVSLLISIVLLSLHIAVSALHFTGAYLMYTPALNSRKRID